MRYAILGLFVLFAWPAHAITYRFETLDGDAGIRSRLLALSATPEKSK